MELVAVKMLRRGHAIDENVEREIIIHRSLSHPNIIQFKEVRLTPSHLAILMEYADGGELFNHVCAVGRLPEDQARFFFQQLVSGVAHLHDNQICHRDLKLENTLVRTLGNGLYDQSRSRTQVCCREGTHVCLLQ